MGSLFQRCECSHFSLQPSHNFSWIHLIFVLTVRAVSKLYKSLQLFLSCYSSKDLIHDRSVWSDSSFLCCCCCCCCCCLKLFVLTSVVKKAGQHKYIISYWDMTTVYIVLDTGSHYILIWNKWCFFIVLNAAFQYSDVIFSTCKTVLFVVILTFTHFVIISTLLIITDQNGIVFIFFWK